MTERPHFHFSLSCIGEGNGNPLQCSCLENPRDGGAWWAAVYGVTQSRTRLKWLSSSSTHTHIYMYIYIYMYCAMLSHFNCVWLFATPWIKAHQAPLSMEFSRQEYCIYLYLTENWAQIKEMTRSPKVQTHLTNTKDHTLLRMILSHHFQIQNRLWKADHWKWKCSRKH